MEHKFRTQVVHDLNNKLEKETRKVMASFLRISMGTTFPTVVLIGFLALYLSVHVMAADDELIRNTCHNAEVPETCIQCVKSDLRSDQADVVLLATIVVDCVTSHADILHGNMSVLASKAKDKVTKEAFEYCSNLFSYAKSDLFAATVGLKSGDYDVADRGVYTAGVYLVTCSGRLEGKKGKDQIEVPETVTYELRIYEELTEAAMKIINRL